MEKFLNKLSTINKDLETKNGVNCLNLLEERLFILLQLGKYDEVIEEGYRVIGKEGPDSFTYKCILVGLCRTNRFDEVRQVLDNWKKTSLDSHDKQLQLEVRTKLESLLNGIRSGMNPAELFKNLEEQIGLSPSTIMKIPNDSATVLYKFRSPQPNQQAFFMCPRIVNGIECLYGDKCFGAHCKDELEEWKQRGIKSIDNSKPGLIANNRIINYTMRSSNSQHIMPINRVKGAGNYLHPPPANISYLKELIHTINTHPNLESYLSENVNGVKVKCYGPLDVKIDKDTTTWTIVIGSRDPLRTVSLLNDLNRINFFISGGFYHYGTDNTTVNLIELHDCNRNNVLQVLNTFIPLQYLQTLGGWPEWFYYKILVTFRTLTTGRFKQTIVFDFKKEPKLVKHFSVEVMNEEPDNNILDQLGELNLVNIEKSLPNLPSPPSSSGMEKLNLNGMVESSLLIPAPVGHSRTVYDSTVGTSIQVAQIQDCHFDKSEIRKISKWNYTEIMGNILKKEKYYRHIELSRLNKIAQLNFSSTYLIDRNNESEMKICIPGEFYATINLERELSFSSICEDSRIGRLVLRSCNHAILTPINQQHKPYLCRIVEKLSSSIIIVIGTNMVQDLAVNSDSSLVFKIEMQLESKGFEDMEYALSLLTVVESGFLFPDLTKEFYYDFDPLNQMFDGSYSLSQRQQLAYKAITSSIRNPQPVPPILLIGSFGSGKTYTLFQSIKAIVQLQPTARILICTHSNSAADLYITAIDEWLNDIQKSNDQHKKNQYIEPLRIYYEERHVPTVPKHVRKYCLFSIDNTKFRYPSKDEVASKNIVIATLSTCLVLNKIGIGKGFFTHVIIDEAAQAMETEAIQPLLYADANTRVVIAGDHMQLSPELFFADDDDSFSLLERLHRLYPVNHQGKIILTENYRTHESILQFASDEFYAGTLISATIQPVHSFYSPVSFVHVQGVERVGSTSFYNMEELTELTSRIKHIVSTWPMTWGKPEAPGSIAVLSAYSDQVIRLRTHFRFSGLAYVTVDRVENVQGKQYRVVFISTVRTITNLNEKTDLGFMSNPKLLNTALTRAQSLVIVVGDSLSLCSVGKCCYVWRNFLTYCSKLNGLHGLDYTALQSSISNVEHISQAQMSTEGSMTTSPWNISPQSSPSPPGFSSFALQNGYGHGNTGNGISSSFNNQIMTSQNSNLLNMHDNYQHQHTNNVITKEYNIHIDSEAYFSISPEKPHLSNGLGHGIVTPVKKPAPGPISRPKSNSFNNDSLFNLASFESGIKEILGETISPPKYKPQQNTPIQQIDSQFQEFVNAHAHGHGLGMSENIRNGLPSPIARPVRANISNSCSIDNLIKENHFYDLWDTGARINKNNNSKASNIQVIQQNQNGERSNTNSNTSHLNLIPPIVSQSTAASKSPNNYFSSNNPINMNGGCTQTQNAQMNQLSAILSSTSSTITNNVNDLNMGTDYSTELNNEPNNTMMMMMMNMKYSPQQHQQQNQNHLLTTPKTEHNKLNNDTTSKSPISLESSDFPPLPEPAINKTPTSEWVQVKSKKSKNQPQPTQQPQQQPTNKNQSKSPEDLTSEEKIQVLVNMGFDKRRSIKALQHTERCLNKAVEILLNGHFKPSA